MTKKITDIYINDWENPQIFERNQVQPHTTLNIFETTEQALNLKERDSIFHFSLNGNWKFNWSENIEIAPADFYQLEYNHEDWDDIKVPSCWQMEGYGHPLFRNVSQSFNSDAPRVPADYNPVGSYVRSFELSKDWQRKKVFLHFEGVKSASYVWINGRKVGYNQGGMEPAEYDITSYLRDGNNKIAVQVLRYSDGTYLECQDMWRLSGIFRDVYLNIVPKVHIRDFYITTDLDSDYKDATLNLEADIRNYQDQDAVNYTVKVRLFNEDKEEVFTKSVEDIKPISSNGQIKVSISEFIKNPAKWSAEYPNLYTMILELYDENNNILEVLKQRIGFRKIEIKNQAIYVNGVPVKFNGVNSHMQHPETGRMIDEATMRKDLILMKKFNINCVRTCHYPPNKRYLELADELGIYIIDETGDEAHADEYLSDAPEWKEQYLDRMRKMVYRDRNHPSVIIWSAGNESGWGKNICSIIENGKKIDPSRPGWLYGGNLDDNSETNPIKCEDIVGPRYPRPLRLEKLFGMVPESVDPRPSFMDEYLSAAGNSLGGLDEYWELIYKYPRLTGGAIWDWISPGLSRKAVITEDKSPINNICALMGNSEIKLMNNSNIKEFHSNKVLSLSGHDEWVEVYRSQELDITGNKLTLSLWVYPDSRDDCSLITKGNNQFGLKLNDNSLEFYIMTQGRRSERVVLKGDLPYYWARKWHHVAGIYDGDKMKLYLDGKLITEKICNQKIKNTPYPVNIGRDAEIHGQNYPGTLFSGLIDKVRIFADSISIKKLYQNSLKLYDESLELNNDSRELHRKSKLWLDFDNTSTGGHFYTLGIGARSYGLVWPDRTIKPELWQVKKSTQPVGFKAVNLEEGRIKIINRHHFKNLNELDGSWELTVSGVNSEILQRGKLDIKLEPQTEKVVEIPLRKDEIKEDCYLLIKFSLAEAKSWAEAGHEIAWEQFELTSEDNKFQKNFKETGMNKDKTDIFKKSGNSEYETDIVKKIEKDEDIIVDKFDNINSSPLVREFTDSRGETGNLYLNEIEQSISVTGELFSYSFDVKTGFLESIKYQDKELIKQGPKFNVWRPPVANELDEWPLYRTDIGYISKGMGNDLANGWRTIGLNNLTHELKKISAVKNDDSEIIISADYLVIGSDYNSGFEANYKYIINEEGKIFINFKASPLSNMTQWLPKIGLQMKLLKEFEELKWFGRGPFENYPDRKTGAKIGIYESNVNDEYQPYLIPQDYGNKTDVRWAFLTNGENKGLAITGCDLLNISVHKYDPDNLTRARHTFQLEDVDYVTLNIDHQVSGVGGTAVSVLNKYKVLPAEYEFAVCLVPF